MMMGGMRGSGLGTGDSGLGTGSSASPHPNPESRIPRPRIPPPLVPRRWSASTGAGRASPCSPGNRSWRPDRRAAVPAAGPGRRRSSCSSASSPSNCASSGRENRWPAASLPFPPRQLALDALQQRVTDAGEGHGDDGRRLAEALGDLPHRSARRVTLLDQFALAAAAIRPCSRPAARPPRRGPPHGVPPGRPARRTVRRRRCAGRGAGRGDGRGPCSGRSCTPRPRSSSPRRTPPNAATSPDWRPGARRWRRPGSAAARGCRRRARAGNSSNCGRTALAESLGFIRRIPRIERTFSRTGGSEASGACPPSQDHLQAAGHCGPFVLRPQL